MLSFSKETEANRFWPIFIELFMEVSPAERGPEFTKLAPFSTTYISFHIT